MTTALIPGSFDPVTNGHVNIIERGTKMFDKVIVGVLHNSKKNPLFSLDEKQELLKSATAHLENVEITTFDGLLIDFAAEKGVSVLLKGLRSVTDFEYEGPMAVMNRRMNSSIETVFLHTDPDYASISSTLIKEVAKYDALPEGFVHAQVKAALKRKFGYES
ncbi:pantetheine-phosphate adenylyltransferase [Alkalicoccus saliphilus]|jgi:pantetheine-phosphate adenylyltransferase|uniref:Phosphopantetheine adenylyltransferase n=1 Tax=Alkalicoccus saliphilus TaxID=200989 RepID=A0A2T4U8K6_9BACI|nr:pantetheine-phosphate adenylyltransferase [Alkalicoccus saliphilus]PTL39726.1 pantetheine-phosphate adenylyltransferase [Alkalicoccus saliphilus]